MIDSRISLKPGDKIQISNDTYTIIKLLCYGGTSLIYEADRVYCDNTNTHSLSINKKVLLKELAPLDIKYKRDLSGRMIFEHGKISLMKKLFKQEIINIAYIQNHNYNSNRLPDMDAYGEYNNTIYIAMNHIKGKLLSDYIYTKEYDDDKVIDIFKQMVLIVKELHELDKPFYHLDLKPSNFIIDEMDSIYLFDFGSCALVDDNRIYAYSEDYSAPEVVFNDVKRVDQRADLYSLGIILYEMITKSKPTLEQVLFKNLNLKEDSTICDKTLIKNVLSRLLKEKVNERISNCNELIKMWRNQAEFN